MLVDYCFRFSEVEPLRAEDEENHLPDKVEL